MSAILRTCALLILLASTLTPAQAREVAPVLPKGIFRARLVGVTTTGVRDTFNDVGRVEGLSYGLNREVTIHDLAAGAGGTSGAQLEAAVSGLNRLRPGLGDSLASSEIFSDVSVRQQIYLGALEYGLTPKLSLGVRLPVVRRSMRQDFRADGVNNAGAVRAGLGDLAPAELGNGLGALAARDLGTGFFEQSLFTSKGYELPRGFDRTQLGDVEVGGKYELYSGEYFYTSALLGVSAPTGAAHNLRNVFDTGNSREAWCYAAQAFQEFYPLRGVTIGANARLAYSLRDARDRAVPSSPTDLLPDLNTQTERVSRQRGAQLDSELSAYYRFPGNFLGIWGAYQYARKGHDRFFGSGVGYYDALARGTDYELHSAEVGAELSSIASFRRGYFPVPAELSLLLNRPLKGVNSPLAPYARLDLLVYF